MTAPSIVELDSRALKYFWYELGSSSSLARAVAKRWVREGGMIQAVVSPCDDLRDLYRFRESRRKLAVGVQEELPESRCAGHRAFDVIETYREYAKGWLGRGMARAVVASNALARRGDPVLREFRSRLRFIGEEVYSVMVASDSEAQLREAILDSFEQPRFHVFYVEADEAVLSALIEVTDLSRELCDIVAEQTVGASASAYDGEGFLIWWRNNAPDAPGD